MNASPAINVLDNCEQALRQAAGTALASGDYDAARQIMAWAQSVAAMANVARIQANPQSPSPPAPPPLPQAPDGSPGRGTPGNAGILPASPAPAPRPFKTRLLQDEYPRFARRNDELVKIGWSKSDRKEYHHRAPKRALDALIATLKRIASGGANFTSENLNPLKDSESGGVFPTYQVFVALAWLRQLGLVKQHGRKGGYTLILERPLDATIAAGWLSLPH